MRRFFRTRGRGLRGLDLVLVSVLFACSTPKARPTVLQPELSPAFPVVSTDDAGSRKEMPRLALRILVGTDLRQRTEDWDARVRGATRHLAALVAASLGYRIVVESILAWEYEGAALDQGLGDLVAREPVAEVTLVLGIIDAPAEPTSSQAALGKSSLFGHHAIVRGVDPAAIDAEISKGVPLDPNQLETLRLQHLEHRLFVRMAHQILRMLGASGCTSSEEVTCEEYSRRQARAPARLEVARAMAAVLAAKEASADDWQVVDTAIRASHEPGAERDRLLKASADRARGQRSVHERESSLAELRQADRERMDKAQRLLASTPSEAWAVFEPVVEIYPDNAVVLELACIIAGRAERADTVARCQLVARTGGVRVSLALAEGHLRAGDAKSAREALDRAAQAAGDGLDDEDWARLARGFQKLGLVTRALRSADKTSSAGEVRKWAARLRARYSVPEPGGDFSDVLEPRYVEAVESALKLVYKSDFVAAAAAANALAEEFPGTAASALVTCDLHVRSKQASLARLGCEKALAIDSANAWAHYLLGVLDERAKQAKSAVEHYRSSIERDPELRESYHNLARVYRRLASPELDALAQEYRRRFSSELPKR